MEVEYAGWKDNALDFQSIGLILRDDHEPLVLH